MPRCPSNIFYAVCVMACVNILIMFHLAERSLRYPDGVIPEEHYLKVNIPSQWAASHGRRNASTSNGIYYIQPHYVKVIAKPRERRSFLTIGIPSAKRPSGDVYLLDTLASILNETSPRDQERIVIFVFLADLDVTYNDEISARIVRQYGGQIASGLIRIVQVAPEVYPPLTNLKRNYHDSTDRVFWRSKQVVDFALMFMYAPNISRYYIQIEDDVVCARNFIPAIERFIERLDARRSQWTMAEFSVLGFIGVLVRSINLRLFAHYLLLFYQEVPVDYLKNNFRQSMAQSQNLWCRTSLFQHKGVKSTLRNKTVQLVDPFFTGGPHSQPNLLIADVVSSMHHHQGFFPALAYNGDSFFWAVNPVVGSFVSVRFIDLVKLHRVVVHTGDPQHPRDILQAGVLDACTISLPECSNGNRTVHLGPFVNGSIDVILPHIPYSIVSVRVRVKLAQQFWIVFRSILVYEKR